MKKAIKYALGFGTSSLIWFSALLLPVQSCEFADELAGTDAGKLEGDWICEEESELLKSTEGVFYYEVTILQDEDVSNRIIIFNFYQLGPYVTAEATVTGLKINLNTEVEGGFEVNGTGTISSSYKQIDWNYTVNDGSGVLDHVTATYTKR